MEKNDSESNNNKNIDTSLTINEPVNNIKGNENNNDYESVPILSQIEPSMPSSIEEYYKINYPEYKIIYFNNHIIVKMGNLYTFNFDKNNNFIPELSIGPHFYLTILLIILILIITTVLYMIIFINNNLFKQIIYFLLIFMEYYFIMKTSLTHVKVVMNKNKNKDESEYCEICKVFYNPKNKVEHCKYCGVCVEKMDHHCVWMGKCVAKNNIFYFYAMNVNLFFLYAYIIFSVIYMAIN